MNKKILAVAVGATLAASAGVTLADVTAYGLAHVSVDYVDADLAPGADITNPWNVSDNSSRFGIKAKEDLGGGWAGLAQFEIYVDNTDTTTVNSNRNNFVGIEQKSVGKLLLGRMDSAVKDVGGIADLFYREQIGESRAIIHSGNGSPDSRYNESVTLQSAKFGPASFKLQWFTKDSQTAAYSNGWNANVKVDVKPVTAGISYYVNERTGAGAENTTGYRLAVKGAIGPVTLTGLYQQVNGITAAANSDASSYGVGAAFKFGNNTIKAQYYLTNPLDTAVVDNGANLMAIGYDHNFSKSTVVYVAYAKITNDDGTAAFTLGGNGHGEAYATPIAGGEVSAVSIGTRMSF